MTYFDWDPGLETGQEQIDSQHQGLFALAGELQAAVDACPADGADRCPADEEALADAIYGLTDYCVQHFADEEDLMAASGYAELPTHRSLHEQLSGETLKYAARYFNDEGVVPETLATFFAQWLTDHIRREDMRFVAYLHTRRA